LHVLDNGRTVPLGTAKQQVLLAVLLLHPNEVVPRDRLIDELWGERPPPTAVKAVQVYVSQLRKALPGNGNAIATHANGYLLELVPDELDAIRFEHIVTAARASAAAGSVEEASQSFERALALWRGRVLAGLPFESYASTDVERLEELRLAAVMDRIDCELALGRHDRVIGELEQLVAEHPLVEQLHGQLMLALYRSGRQAEALRAYRDARDTLVEQFGIEPSAPLQRLEHAILVQDASLEAPTGVARIGERTTPTPTPPATPSRPQMPPPRRRRTLFASATLVVVALAVAAGLLATRDSAAGLTEVRPNHVGVIDPETNTVMDEIRVGIRPGPVAFGGGSVWVGNLEDRTLTRIDPEQRSTAATISLEGRTPTGLTFGASAVWVAHGEGGELSRIDPKLERVTETLQVATPSSQLGTVDFGDGSVWAVYGDSTIARVDPLAVRVSGSAYRVETLYAVVVARGLVWVTNSPQATVTRFNPATFEQGPVGAIRVWRTPVAIAFGEGAIWVANRDDDKVTRIDPATTGTTTVPVGDGPTAIAVGAGSVWVANERAGTISRIDASTYEVVRTIEVGDTPTGIAFGAGAVWVTMQAR
jgi:YVTN family beta-propeller protein